MSPGVAPELDDEVAEAVDDGGVLLEVRGALDVAHRSQPLRDTVEVAEPRFSEARIESAVSRAAS